MALAKEKLTIQGDRPSKFLLMALRCTGASSGDCPPDKNAIAGTAARTEFFRQFTVASATSSILSFLVAPVPQTMPLF
ncbi:MAG: hypothetical protein ABI863_02415 [Ginsengibacter sp.]